MWTGSDFTKKSLLMYCALQKLGLNQITISVLTQDSGPIITQKLRLVLKSQNLLLASDQGCISILVLL